MLNPQTARAQLEARLGLAVLDTSEMLDQFDAIGFLAPFVLVRRKSDGVQGTLEFTHLPRFYWGFKPEEEH